MRCMILHILFVGLFSVIPLFLDAQSGIQHDENYIKVDTSIHKILPEVNVYPTPKFTSNRMERRYWRLVRDVKKTLPYANEISAMVIAANDTLQTLKNDKERRKYLKIKEKELLSDYDKPMRSLTLSQGRLLIKLVDRNCSETSFELVKMYRGGFTAFFWQSFARIMGANLKDEYDPDGEDQMIEHVIYLVENGFL